MELYIFRHGQTVWNAAHKIQGSTDIELTEEGRNIARITSEAIRNIHFDAIYSSPLQRAYETACILKGDRDMKVVKDKRIRELCFGILEGTDFSNIQSPDCDARFSVFFSHPEAYHRPPNGESLKELCDRTADFIEDIKDLYPKDARIMIVAHGAADKAMMKHIKGLEMKDFWSGGLLLNCGAVIVEVDGDTYHIVDENKVFYDPEK